LMGDSTAFDQLVQTLSFPERRELLEKIEASFSVSSEPLKKEDPEEKLTYDVEAEFQNLNLIRRFIIWLTSMFTKRDRSSVMMDVLLKDLRRRIVGHYSGLIDAHSPLLCEKMYGELVRLKEGSLFFRTFLRQAMGSDRVEFFAFLVEIEAESVQERLHTELQLFQLQDSSRLFFLDTPKSEIVERFNGIVEEIPPEDKKKLYQDAQSLYCLHNLSLFSFDTVLGSFRPGRAEGEYECDFTKIRKTFVRLSELLEAADRAPSAAALRALFLFYYRDKLLELDADLEEQIREAFSDAQSALNSIREFNDRVPFNLIVKYVTQDLNYTPREIGGGEDWFVSFKEFWKRKIDNTYQIYNMRKKRQKLVENAAEFLDLKELPKLGFRTLLLLEKAFPINHELSLSFLKGFITSAYKRVARSMKLIYLNGEFYKEQNRKDFTEALDYINTLKERIEGIETRFEKKGDLGEKILKIKDEAENTIIRGKRIQEVISEIDSEVNSLIDTTSTRLNNLVLVLDGILHGQPGARFDTLSNLESLGARGSKLVITSWRKSLEILSKAFRLLTEIRDIEAKLPS